MGRLLVIDDDENIRDLIGSFFGEKGFEIQSASNGSSGLDILKKERFDLYFLDLVLPDIHGLDLLKEAVKSRVSALAIVITGYGSLKSAVEAVKLGAFDYISKPFDLDELLIIVERALKMSSLENENVRLKKQLKKKYDFPMLIGNSPQMQDVYALISKVADTDATVLITGESGTGKERVAKTIHYNCSRAKKPFIPVNCAAIPETLLESELFGHEKGAFTGAVNSRAGRFELANGGTIFLDEIGELRPHLQVKLLRVLQEMEFERVGGMKTLKVDVRVLVATNMDLEEAIRAGKFREDLFYRLNVIPLHLPSLRERHEDIPLFVEHFIKEFSRKKNTQPLKIMPGAMQCLHAYSWPGNVRELENLMERMVILSDDVNVDTAELPERFRQPLAGAMPPAGDDSRFSLPQGGLQLNSVLEDIERELIVEAMKRVGGVKSRAAALLGLNRTTLIEKIKKKGIGLDK